MCHHETDKLQRHWLKLVRGAINIIITYMMIYHYICTFILTEHVFNILPWCLYVYIYISLIGEDTSSNTLNTKMCDSYLKNWKLPVVVSPRPSLFIEFRTNNETTANENGFRIYSVSGRDLCEYAWLRILCLTRCYSQHFTCQCNSSILFHTLSFAFGNYTNQESFKYTEQIMWNYSRRI